MNAYLLWPLICLSLHSRAQTTVAAISKTAAAATPALHNGIVLPLYEVKYEGKVLRTDPQVIWLDKGIDAGDTIKLSDENLRLDKSTLSFTSGSEVFEVEL